MPTRSRPGASLRAAGGAVLVALVALVAACGVTGPAATSPAPSTPLPTPSAATPSASGGVDPATIYDRIEQEVIAVRGLDALADVRRTTIDKARLRELLAEITAEEQPLTQVAATETLYRGLGLLGAEESLAALTEELLGDQVAGFYRTDTGELYVVSRSGAGGSGGSGGVGVEEKVIFAHEFTHALQDQHFGLDPLTADAFAEGDRALARTGLIEGDATLLMSLWAQDHLSFVELLQLVGLAIGPNQAGLEGVPPFLRESLLFPYETGLAFAMGIHAQGGWEAVNAAFENPPDTTEQILHPEKYTAREAPVDVELPAGLAARMGAGWTLTLEDTLGEFQLAAWLRAHGVETAGDAAAGWGGDRVGLLEGPDGRWAIVLMTAWDSAAEAAAFETAVPALPNSRVSRPRDGVDVAIGSDAAALDAVLAAAST